MPLHVAVDMDDVMGDFTAYMMARMNSDFGTSFTPEADGTEWHWYKAFDWKAHGFKDWWEWMRRNPGQWADTPPVDGAIGGVAALRAQGHWVELVTSKPEWAVWEVFEWLGKNRAVFDQVTIVGKNDIKADYSKADVLVDDKLQNGHEWVATDRNVVLFDRPWNRYGLQPAGIVRALDWPNVVRHITTLALEEAA